MHSLWYATRDLPEPGGALCWSFDDAFGWLRDLGPHRPAHPRAQLGAVS
ncbi:MAG: hypothetical protein GYB67_02430 [Chloroflexi bacterium]|nr:hypothetical protein [Chloroflexota bacterium]